LAVVAGTASDPGRYDRQAVRDWPHNIDDSEPDNDEWRAHAEQCLEQAAAADIVLLYVDPDDARHFGALLEAGAALGTGRQVFLVSRHPWPFLRHHPRCRSFNSIADAITAITAIQAGEEARTVALLVGGHGRAA
jgi:nucleoside 2-deoxyribosyltransferase